MAKPFKGRKGREGPAFSGIWPTPRYSDLPPAEPHTEDVVRQIKAQEPELIETPVTGGQHGPPPPSETEVRRADVRHQLEGALLILAGGVLLLAVMSANWGLSTAVEAVFFKIGPGSTTIALGLAEGLVVIGVFLLWWGRRRRPA